MEWHAHLHDRDKNTCEAVKVSAVTAGRVIDCICKIGMERND